MSRIGRLPIHVPAGVTVSIDDTNLVTVKGPKGTLTQKVSSDVKIENKDGVLHFTRDNDDRRIRAMHGLYRVLVHNMVIGVSEGFSKTLTIIGTGYRAQLQGKNLVLNMGYSHPVEMVPAEGISFEVPNPTTIIVRGYDKQAVGQTAAEIRAVRPPEPYLGKGIRYENEHVRRKAGKAAK